MVRTLLVSLLLIFVASAAGRAGDEDEAVATLPFKLRDRDEAKHDLREIERFLGDGRVEMALSKAQEVLDDMREDLVLVEGNPASTRWRLAAERVREILAGLPPERRAVYERLVGGAAKEALGRALASRNVGLLEDIVERYGASDAGVRAARMLGAVRLEAGRAPDAAWWAAEGLRFAPADPVLLSLEVDAWGVGADRGSLARFVEAPPPGAPPALVARAKAWRLRLGTPEPQPDLWPLWGGDATRNAPATSRGPALETPRWQSPIALPIRRLDRNVPRGFGLEDDQQSFWAWWDSFRPLHPAVEGHTAYVGNGRALYAIDVYSGRRLWAFDDESGSPLSLIGPDRMGEGRTSFERAYAPVVAGDLVVGTVEVEHPYERDELQYVEISTYLPQRIVVALDRKTGALRWWMGGQPGDGLRLDGVSVVSPVAVSDGVVVGATSRHTGTQHQVGMIGLDLETGRVIWYRILGVGQQELNLFGAPVKELAASAPAVADGVAFASSGLGFVSALSIRTGRPVWVASYEIQPIWPVQYWFRAPLRFPLVGPSPVVVDGDLVLVAPTDGRHLSAYDRSDGSLRWRVGYPPPRIRGGTAQFLGTANDGHRDVALMAADDLRAYAVEDGSLVWRGAFQTRAGEPNAAIGRGIVAGRTVLAPTRQGVAVFDLDREGSFAGMTPWPPGMEGGSLLPLPQVLLISERDAVVGFYSWERIEKDIARRQRERPGDPAVLLEAGNVYAMGGAFDRALDAYRGALKLARASDDETSTERARAGLFRTWVTIAEKRRSADVPGAREALRTALDLAATTYQRALARVRLDELLQHDAPARAENLRALVETSAGIVMHFDGYRDEVPVRAAALLELARTERERERPKAAIAALQRVLAEEGERRIDDVSARQRARVMIDEIKHRFGEGAYAEEEAKAERLLQQAREVGDPGLLADILRRFPNASIVPEALYRLAAARLEGRTPAAAVDPLVDLLREHPSGEWGAKAAARLAGVYETLGLEGAARFAWTWLAAHHPDAPIEADGGTARGADRAARALARLDTAGPPPPRPLAPALREVRVVMASGDSYGAQVEVAAPPGETAPLALYRDGDRLVAFDLPNARVAFDLEPGQVRRAAWDAETVVLAVRSQLLGLDAKSGRPRWDVDFRGAVTDLRTASGLVFALVTDDTTRGQRVLVALDLERGTEIWRRLLDPEDYRDLDVAGTDVVLRRSRYDAATEWPSLLLYDGLTGELANVVDLPAGGHVYGPVRSGRNVVYVQTSGEDPAALEGRSLDRREASWRRALLGKEGPSALVPFDDGQVLVLQRDGFVSSCRASDGAPGDATRILVATDGEGHRPVRPQPLTAVHVAGDAIVFSPYVFSSPSYVAAWNRHSGKLLWERRWPMEAPADRSALVVPDAGPLLAMGAWTRNLATPDVRLRLLDRRTGNVLQEIEPQGLGNAQGPLSVSAGWGTVVVFGHDSAIIYASP